MLAAALGTVYGRMKRVKDALSRFWTRARGLAGRGRGGDGREEREKSPGNGVLPRLIPFAAGAFWLWFFARRDVYRPEPKRLLALSFFLGVVSAVPAAAIEYVFIADSDFASMAFGTLAANMLFVVGPVEEIAKFLAVQLGGVPLAALRRAGRRAGLRRRRQSWVRVHRKSGLRLGVRAGGDDTPRAAVHRGARSIRRVLGIRARLAGGRRRDAERVLGRRRRAAGGVRRSWDVQHSGVRDAARRNRADGARRVVCAVEIRLGAARLAPFRYRRSYPKIACAACGWRIAAISRFRRFRGARAARRRQAAAPTADDAPPQAGRTPPTAPPAATSSFCERSAVQDGESARARS